MGSVRDKLLWIASLGGVVLAFFGSCCALPLLLMGLGVGSAGLVSTPAPFKPYLIGMTVLLFGIAFYAVYGCRTTCNGEGSCNVKTIRRTRILLWVATGLALLFLIGPQLLSF
jgi:hypothetical protein